MNLRILESNWKVLVAIWVLCSCANDESKFHSVLSQIYSFKNSEEMGYPENEARVEKLCNVLFKNSYLIRELEGELKKSTDRNFQSCVMYLATVLSFKIKKHPDFRTTLLPLVFAGLSYGDSNVRHRAGAILAICADESTQDSLIKLFGDQDSIMWRHGVRGLWNIGTIEAHEKLIELVETKKTNRKFLRIVNQIVTQNLEKKTEVDVKEKVLDLLELSSKSRTFSEHISELWETGEVDEAYMVAKNRVEKNKNDLSALLVKLHYEYIYFKLDDLLSTIDLALDVSSTIVTPEFEKKRPSLVEEIILIKELVVDSTPEIIEMQKQKIDPGIEIGFLGEIEALEADGLVPPISDKEIVQRK